MLVHRPEPYSINDRMQNKITKTDQELVTATLSDRHAFSEIVHRYEKPIRRYVRRLGCTERSDIEDVLQEIFIKVFINLNGYDFGLKFSSWLYSIAHNETISFFRKKNVRPNVLNLVRKTQKLFSHNWLTIKILLSLLTSKMMFGLYATSFPILIKSIKKFLCFDFLKKKVILK